MDIKDLIKTLTTPSWALIPQKRFEPIAGYYLSWRANFYVNKFCSTLLRINSQLATLKGHSFHLHKIHVNKISATASSVLLKSLWRLKETKKEK